MQAKQTKSNTASTTTKTAETAQKASIKAGDAARVPAWANAQSSSTNLQAKLTINQPGDIYEQEADRVAEQVMRMPDSSKTIQRKCACGGTAGPTGECEECAKKRMALQRKSAQATSDTTAPSIVNSVLSSNGMPIDASTRSFMEPRFGYDFGNVRIHTDQQSAESAQAVNALAYTVGSDVVFGTGQYRPETNEGQKLLAHELTHVVQQSSHDTVHRKDDPSANEKKATYPIKIPPGTTSAQEFRRYAETIIFGRVVNFKWTAQSGLLDIYADITKHIGTVVNFKVPVANIAAYGSTSPTDNKAYSALGSEEREGINEEIDKRYYSSTGVEPGTKIQKGETGKVAIWNSFKQQVMADRKKLDALPPTIKEFLKSSDTFKPENYEILSRLADKLTQFSAADLEDYKSKVNAETSDLRELEASIDRFLAARAERQSKLEALEKIKTQLFGLEELYKKYIDWKKMEGAEKMIPETDEFGVHDPNKGYIRAARDKLYQELATNLPRYGFATIADFEKTIADYEMVFRQETVAIAFDMLAKYEHVLYEQERRYQTTAETGALYQQLHPARLHFQEAIRIRKEHAEMPMTPDEMAEQAYWSGQFQQEQAQGRSVVASLSKTHPFLANLKQEQQEKLALADEGQVQSLLLDFIHEHQQGIKDTRQDLTDDSELAYKFDKLLKASYQKQAITPNSIYDLIIQDKIKHLSLKKALKAIALTILAIVLTIFTAGGGAVAVVGAAGLFGLSAYQAYESFRDYETEASANKAQLLSEEPGLFWVIVAVVGAGIDLGSAVGAIRAMKPAIEAFNATGDLAKLEKSLQELKEVNVALQQNVVKAAKAELQYRSAVQDIFSSGGRLRMAVVPFAEEFSKFVVAAYFMAKRGIIGFERFLLELKAQKLIGELKDLSPEQLSILKKAFEEGLEKSRSGLLDVAKLSDKVRGTYTAEQLEEVAARGKALGMGDDEIANVLEKGAASNKGAKQLQNEMEAASETQRLTKHFEGMSDEQVRSILKTDPDAPFELMRRYRLKTEEELNALSKANDETAKLVLRERKIAFIDDIVSLVQKLPEDQQNRILLRIVKRDVKGRPFGTPQNPRLPSIEEFNPRIREVKAGDLETLITIKHGLFPEQVEQIRGLSNVELIRFRMEDPISAAGQGGGLLLTGGHHRTAEIARRVEAGKLSSDTIVRILIHD